MYLFQILHTCTFLSNFRSNNNNNNNNTVQEKNCKNVTEKCSLYKRLTCPSMSIKP